MTLTNAPAAAGPTPTRKGRLLDSWQFWGAVMVVPYLLVFFLLVVYPVLYAF